ncbi:MAG TPA: sigma-E factor negative regulatory protein [Rhodanobacteraceae bacterium]|nr:sigma-E factor negative regulatory protein [Rhodanobacteraceae bacterium]
MNPAEHENLSALMDGQLSRDQIRFTLRRIDGNVSLRGAWERYHVMGDSLRHEMHGLADAGFAEQVMRRIDEASAAARHRRAPHRWLRWSAGGAIAAGVAVAALVVVQPQMRGARTASTPSPQQAVAAATPPAAAPAANEPMSAPTVPRWLSASPVAAQLAQPAAATFSPNGQPLRLPESQGYSSPGLAPYMTIPHARGLSIRGSTRQTPHRWWPSATSHRQPAQQEWRLQAQ